MQKVKKYSKIIQLSGVIMKIIEGNKLDINAAIGLNYIDLIEISDYFSKIFTEDNREKIDVDYYTKMLKKFHEANLTVGSDEYICDITTIRMLGLINEKDFELTKEFLGYIHESIFKDIIVTAGKFRDFNVSFKEKILHGESVKYANYNMINDSLEYDLLSIKSQKIELKNIQEKLQSLVAFNSNIWQVHPFKDGNTRTTAIFMIRLMKKYKINIDSMAFTDNAQYYRDALVRSNYYDQANQISSTSEYLTLFYENLLLSKNHELKSANLMIRK